MVFKLIIFILECTVLANLTKIIAIEGIDGSGKTLQSNLIAQWFKQQGKTVLEKSFPQYNEFFGKQIGSFLSGERLRADEIDSKSMSLWYAMDRFNAFKDYIDGQYDVMIINRYVMSNMVYQTIREIDIKNNDTDNFDWIMQLEHDILGLPVPNLYLVLDVRPDFAQKNVDKKEEREYVSGRDVYEGQKDLLQRAREKYLTIANTLDYASIIQCMKNDSFLNQDEIFNKIKAELTKRNFI